MHDLNISVPSYLALSGRIENWVKNPKDFLPASCTVFNVRDSLLNGLDSIADSFTFTIYGLSHGAGVALNLSELRPANTTNSRGLVASGATSFGKIYSMLNEVIRRGGVYKNGAITLFIDCDSKDIREYLETKDLAWAKRAVYINKEKWKRMHPAHRTLLAKKVNDGSVWLAKPQWDDKGKRIYSNVCLEVLLPSRGTCILSSVNMGMVESLEDIPMMFSTSMAALCRIHANTRVDQDGFYLSPKEDKQVGLGVIGFANLLARFDITYEDFTYALEKRLGLRKGAKHDAVFDNAYYLADYLVEAHDKAADVALQHGMERAFSIAPTASMSYRHSDLDGYTTAPEISPPLHRKVDRDSDTFGVETFEYHPQTEIAVEVGWDTQFRLLKAWQTMIDNTGLAHAISANLWTSFVVTEDWIENEFLPSPLKTTYYRLQIDQKALDKSQVMDEAYYTSLLEDPNYCTSCGG